MLNTYDFYFSYFFHVFLKNKIYFLVYCNYSKEECYIVIKLKEQFFDIKGAILWQVHRRVLKSCFLLAKTDDNYSILNLHEIRTQKYIASLMG